MSLLFNDSCVKVCFVTSKLGDQNGDVEKWIKKSNKFAESIKLEPS